MIDESKLLENKNNYIKLLKSTNRYKIEDVIDWLESTDFFEAPASTMYHENYTGGLCEHSLKVYDNMMKLKQEFKFDIDDEQIIIMTLLHDVCKANTYIKDKKNQKIGQNWVTVDYWKRNDDYPIGHGQKSVIEIQKTGFILTDLEILSIVAHMNGYDKSDLFNASNIYDTNELTIWLHLADMIATYKDRKVV